MISDKDKLTNKNQKDKINNENSKTELQNKHVENKIDKYCNNFFKNNFKDLNNKLKQRQPNEKPLYRNNKKSIHGSDNREVPPKKFYNDYFNCKNSINTDQGTKIIDTENNNQIKETNNRNRFSNINDQEKSRCTTHRSKKISKKSSTISNESRSQRAQRNESVDAPKRKAKKIKMTIYSYLQKLTADKDDIILFKNDIKENNCFLNAIIQVLFHLDKFKSKLMEIKVANNEKDPISQLYNIFDDYNYFLSNYSTDLLNVSFLRDSLHFKYGTYPKGKTGDPMETISHLLDLIHNTYKSNCNNINNSIVRTSSINSKKSISDEYCKDEQCPSHSNFLLRLKEIKICPKCHKSNVMHFDKDCFMYAVYSYEILSIIKNENYDTYQNSLFKKLKILASSFGDNKIKLEECTCSEINTEKRLVLCNKCSPYLIINLTWDSDFPLMNDICKMYGLITITDSNSSLFDLFSIENKDLKTFYYLFSMILYGQNHYTCCFYNTKIKCWSFIDDNNKKSFKSYTELIQFLIDRRSIPVGIIYSDENYIDMENMKDCFLDENIFKKIYDKSEMIDKNIYCDENDDDWDIELGEKIRSCGDVGKLMKKEDDKNKNKKKEGEKAESKEKEMVKRSSQKKMTK